MATAIPLTRLNADALGHLHPDVRIPTYDRSRLTPGVVHIGVGGFHRAHQAVYLDDLFHSPGNEAYGLCGVGLLPQDRRMRDVLREQDYLYTVVTRDAHGDRARVIGSILEFLFATEDPERVIERMAAPETRIVSLTITEASYCINQATGEVDERHPEIVRDLQDPAHPIGTFGYLAEALHRRHQRRLPPFTVMSCDNLQHNGDVCRQVLLGFLERSDRTLAKWVAREGAFPNSMGDRITPSTTDVERELVRESFGLDDGWPVVTEPFRQWVIEDRFANGRPAWEAVGAQLVQDVSPYERMKIRLLNGGHQALCFIAMLLGYRNAPPAMEDAEVRALVRWFMDREVTPLLPPVPGIDLEDYKQTLLERFGNPAMNDQLGRIGTNGSARIAEFVLPTASEQLTRGGPITIAAFTVAAWIRYLAGRDDQGREVPFSDPLGDTLLERARRGGADASPVLSLRQVFGEQLATSQRFVDEVKAFLQRFYGHGARATLKHCLERAR